MFVLVADSNLDSIAYYRLASREFQISRRSLYYANEVAICDNTDNTIVLSVLSGIYNNFLDSNRFVQSQGEPTGSIIGADDYTILT